MNTNMGNKLAASVRGAKQLSDTKEPAAKPEPKAAPEVKKEAKVVVASSRVWPD